VNFSKFPSRTVCVLVLLPLTMTAQRMQEGIVPLKNWTAPLYWHPNQAESEASAKATQTTPQLQFSLGQTSAAALTFVAITPCRLVDTRGTAAGFNGITPFSGPSVAAATTVTFPVLSASEASTDTTPAPCGAIPAIAQAYSLNLTVIPHAGAVNYVTVYPAGSTKPVVSTINDLQGLLVANAAIVSGGTPSGGVSVYNDGPATIDVILDMNGFFTVPSDLNGNTAVGMGTLGSNTGSYNTATGAVALQDNSTGNYNTAMGFSALQANSTGASNTAIGTSALQLNTTGGSNTASGANALENNTSGNANTATGSKRWRTTPPGVSQPLTAAGRWLTISAESATLPLDSTLWAATLLVATIQPPAMGRC
jgi:hypothetical protein